MKFKYIFTGIALAAMLASCGGDAKKEDKKESISIGSKKEEASKKADAKADKEKSKIDSEKADVIKLSIEGNDQMKFNKKELKAKAGQKVELTLKHVGEMSKETMGHNFVLLEKGTDMMAFGEKASGAKDNDYIPEGSDEVIAHTELIGGGEKTTLKFTAPEEKGEYDFICSFPGHVALMKGKFIVE